MKHRDYFIVITFIIIFSCTNIVFAQASIAGGPDISGAPENNADIYAFYECMSFNVSEYNIQEVIGNARKLDYTIKFSTSCLDLPVNECENRGWLKESSEEGSSNKILSVSTAIRMNDETNEFENITYIGLIISSANYELNAAPKDSLKESYVWYSTIRQKNQAFGIDLITQALVKELKELGISDADLQINCEKLENVPSLHQTNATSQPEATSKGSARLEVLIFILTLLFICVIVLTIILSKRKRAK